MKLHHHVNPTLILLVTSVFSVFGSNKIALDLSYQSKLSAGIIEQAIHNAITRNTDISEAYIDVSFSELGNVGITDLVTSILSLKRNSELCLDVKTRMNRLTPEGVSDILARILERDEREKITKAPKNEEDDIADNRTDEKPNSLIRLLDLSWNDLDVGNKGNKVFLSNIRKLVGNTLLCPSELYFNRCSLGPAFCRSFGKGLVNRYSDVNNTEAVSTSPLSLYLCGNPDVGDAGVAALAAAIRGTKDPKKEIFSTLDLSACNIGDSGAEALALALESHPNSINRLILSNNKISDTGARSIANSIMLNSKSKMQRLELDNNSGIKNLGAIALAHTISKGALSSLSLRSCEIKAEGVKAFGECLKTWSKRKNPPADSIDIDLSGNPIGILKKKKKKDSLKSKASAKTASYVNFIGKQIKSGLKDVGLDNVLGTSSLESDDEEEERMGGDDEESSDEPARCGAKALASTIVLSEEESHENPISTKSLSKIKCKLGMRHCLLDQGAADALAATIIHANTHYGIDLVIDAELNNVWEDDMIQAVRGSDEDTLESMAERYIEAMEAIRAAEDRAARASAAAAARSQYSQWSDVEEDSIHTLDALDSFDDNDDYDDDFQYDDNY